MIRNNLYMIFLVFLVSFYSITDLFASDRQNRKGSAKYKTTANYPARASPGARASPEDTTQYSIKMDGRSNTIILNGKMLVTSPDTTEKQNNIRVTGEGNSVTLHLTDLKSEVNITQQGKNNHIKISQTQKSFKQSYFNN